jgi:tRNA modification GTPase
MMFDPQRTIVALSSGAMPGRRAIVRLSGPDTTSILRQLFVGKQDGTLLESAVARSQVVTCSTTWPGRTVATRAYYWPDTRSFTGEPCAELHLTGSLPVAEALMARLGELGAAYAERGEFTLRSFLAGKVDLTQAEAVLGVIQAEGDLELQRALAQLSGNLSQPVRQLREELLDLISHLEAGLDFVEEDIQFITETELTTQLRAINDRIERLMDQIDSRDARSHTAQVIIVGLPNAGKSSLFNALAQEERVIVSAQAGTTRDVVSQHLAIEGTKVELIDTAGLEELVDQTPRAAAQVALHQRLSRADLALLCFDSSQPLSTAAIKDRLEWLCEWKVPAICVGTKADRSCDSGKPLGLDVMVSSQQGVGLDTLRQRIAAKLAAHQREYQSDAMHFTAMRSLRSLKQAHRTLEQAISLAEIGAGEELVAAELRMALDDLSSIIGEVHSDDILGEIFSRFCIGK